MEEKFDRGTILGYFAFPTLRYDSILPGDAIPFYFTDKLSVSLSLFTPATIKISVDYVASNVKYFKQTFYTSRSSAILT